MILDTNSNVERRSSSYLIQLFVNIQFHKKSKKTKRIREALSQEKKENNIIDEACSFSKHSNDSFENVDITLEEDVATDTKYCMVIDFGHSINVGI